MEVMCKKVMPKFSKILDLMRGSYYLLRGKNDIIFLFNLQGLSGVLAVITLKVFIIQHKKSSIHMIF